MDYQSNNIAPALCFFLHTFKPSNFAISVGREQKATTFVYFSEIRNSLLEFNSGKGRQHLTKWRANKFKITRIQSLSDVFARLRVVPHFSSGIVEWAKRERAWKSTHARKGDTRRGSSLFSPPSSRWLSTRTKSSQQPGANFTSKANENEMEYEYDFSYLIRGLNLPVSKCNWTTWNITGFTNFEKLYSYSNLIAKKIRRLSSRHLVNTQFAHFEVSLREIYHIIYCHQCTRFADNGLSNDRGVTVDKKNIHRLRLFDKKGLF